MALLGALKGMDAYPKTINEFKVHTMQGGFFSVLAFAFITVLLISELSYYLSTDTVDKMMVDGGRNTMVRISFDITFPRMPCAVVAVESEDASGDAHHDIEHNIEKIWLDEKGDELSQVTKDMIGGALTNHTDFDGTTGMQKPACGDCYSAAPAGKCCNTCEEVKSAYRTKGWRLPSLHSLSQCQEVAVEKLLRGELVEGCRIEGELVVTKASGKFFFAPSKYFANGYLSFKDALDTTFQVFDTSHVINQLTFGDLYPEMENPLDGRVKSLQGVDRGTYQYFLNIVPTEYKYLNSYSIATNQFSATELFQERTPVSGTGLPMVSFSYSFSPIMFRIEQYRAGFVQFLTSVCAIVGGIFTIMGLMDSFTFSLLNRNAGAPLAM